MTGRTRRAHVGHQLLRGDLAVEPQEPTQAHVGARGQADVDVRGECAVLDAVGVGRFLGVGKSKVYELDARDELPASVQVGRVRRWVKAEIEAWLLHGAPKRAAWARLWPRVRKQVLKR